MVTPSHEAITWQQRRTIQPLWLSFLAFSIHFTLFNSQFRYRWNGRVEVHSSSSWLTRQAADERRDDIPMRAAESRALHRKRRMEHRSRRLDMGNEAEVLPTARQSVSRAHATFQKRVNTCTRDWRQHRIRKRQFDDCRSYRFTENSNWQCPFSMLKRHLFGEEALCCVYRWFVVNGRVHVNKLWFCRALETRFKLLYFNLRNVITHTYTR